MVAAVQTGHKTSRVSSDGKHICATLVRWQESILPPTLFPHTHAAPYPQKMCSFSI